MTVIKDRILTTHTGSLPRGEPLGSMLIDQEQGEPVGGASSALRSISGSRTSSRDKLRSASTSRTTASKAASASRLI